MKYILSLLILTSSFLMSGDVYVDGYTRFNGTYVEGHYRSSPNDTVSDNFSTDGNVNPYTGEEGHRNVDDDAYYDGNDYSQTPLESSSYSTNQSDNTPLIVGGVLIGLTVIIAILTILARIQFVSYLAANAKFALTTWIMLTIVNQFVFFGACLAPYCILASIPHVSLITLGIMYLMYKSALTTYDPKTGYNQFGYDQDGYDLNGYGLDGYDKQGYNVKGLNRDGKDRLGMSYISRKVFSSQEVREKLLTMNKEAIKKNKADQISKHNLSEKIDVCIMEENTETVKKPMSEMDRFFNEPLIKEPKQEENISKKSSDYNYDKRMREIQNALADYKTRK